MNQFPDNIWISSTELKFAGIEVGARMTIIDLGKGELLVHSPIRLTEQLKAQIAKLGTVTYVIAPNRMHHLFIGDFKTAFPDAKFFCSPGLEKKRSDFKFDGVIDDAQNFPWNEALKHKCVRGSPFYNEVVFFDPRVQTLIVSDLAVHICESKSWTSRLVFKAIGAYKKFGWTKIEKILFIQNRKKFYESIEAILSWEFDRVIMAHGKPVSVGGKSEFRKAFTP